MAQLRSTRILLRDSTSIPLFWFLEVDEEQRASTELVLNLIADQHATNNPESKKKRIVSVPWLRNYASSVADVIATARGFAMGEGHALGIDAQSLADETLLVLHCVHNRNPEIGRSARMDAVSALLSEQLYKCTLAEAFGDSPWRSITMKPPETIAIESELGYSLPPHIPRDLKLREDKMVLFSLIRLTDEEIFGLQQEIGEATNEVEIYNWPHESPASQAETYGIFQSVKPEAPVPLGQTFVMFIDAAHMSGPQRVPLVVVACESALTGMNQKMRLSKLEQMQHNHIYLRAERAQSVKSLWPLIWHPPNRGTVNDVAVNYPLFYGPQHRYNDPKASDNMNWNDPVLRYQSAFIPNPRLPVCATGAASPEYVAYILCPVTPEEVRILRNVLKLENGGAPMLIELNIVPRSSEAERQEAIKEGRETDPHTRLDVLLEFFDTPAYRAIAVPPDTFVFLDNDALKTLLSDISEDFKVPIATTYHHFHRDENRRLIAVEEPAYQFANISIAEDLESTLANIDTGNMWFWELVSYYDSELFVAFWPEYKGSMTKEMLDIQWEWS